MGPYPVSLLSQPMKQWRKPNICRQQATRLTGPISPTCDRYVQNLLMGINPSVLNRHRWGLPHRSLKIATSLSPSFPFECSTDPLNGPARSPFYLILISNKGQCIRYCRHVVFRPLNAYRHLCLRLVISNDR
jgi:hypothetical protein